MQNKFLVLYGPTGVGKTELSRIIAHNISAEIINMDVGQLYTPFSIGTAKPAHWQTDSIVHHLFDIVNNPENITVVKYKTMVMQLIQEIQSRGRLPILVGGSGFYLRSLLFPPFFSYTNDVNVLVCNEKKKSWDDLYAIDPVRASQIEPHDTYRISRALELWEKTKRLPSSCKPIYSPIADYNIIFLTRDREQLYQRINERVETMLQSGWITEVQAILGTKWEQFILEKKLIGYNELVLHMQKKDADLDSITTTIKQRTRHYAKRQLTFWRMLYKQIILNDPYKKNDVYTINLTEVEKNINNNDMISSLQIATTIDAIKKWMKKNKKENV